MTQKEEAITDETIRQLSWILRNLHSESRGVRLTKTEVPKGRSLRDKLFQTQGAQFNPLLIQAAQVWIARNHPEEILQWHAGSGSYTFGKWWRDGRLLSTGQKR